MSIYDPTMEALVHQLVDELTATEAVEGEGYIAELRALQATLAERMRSAQEPLEPDTSQALRQTLGHLDPKAGDATLEDEEVLRRLLSAVDRELFRWTSGMVQPPGPSGDAQVAVVDQPVA